MIGYIDHIHNEDTTYTIGEIYKPEIDHYEMATIVGIVDDKLIVYNNNYDLEYSADTLYTVSITDDTMFVTMSHGDTLAVAYYFNDEGHWIWITEDEENYTGEIHFEKYSGPVPPDTWVMELPDDDYEPDNTIDQAPDLHLNIQQSHTLTENDTDYCRIRAKAGTSYLIRGLAYFEMEMYLYDKNGDSLAFDDDNDLRIIGLGDESETVILWTCNETDDYYSMIVLGNRYPWNNYQGYYQMLVTEVDTNDIEYGPRPPIFIYEGIRSGNDMINNIFKK